MEYFIKTHQGTVVDDNQEIIKFNLYNDAWHWAVNHLDLSVYGLEIVRLDKLAAYKGWLKVGV